MKKSDKIKELKFDLNRSQKTIKRMHQKFNSILEILFSSLDADEKNRQIGWQVVNEKIDNASN